jgi:hypothetical protein
VFKTEKKDIKIIQIYIENIGSGSVSISDPDLKLDVYINKNRQKKD